jgi:hypothetical protein
VASRKETDYIFALNRMQSAGAEVTTVEAILFELFPGAAYPKFKEISKLVK